MQFVDLLGRTSLAHAVAWAGLWACNASVGAQETEAAAVISAPAIVATPPVVRITPSFAPTWQTLSPIQQNSLAPLARTWDSLSDGHRRKWIALAKNYPTMGSAEQEKLHSRMAEWTALSPRDRELARLNFVESKKLPPPDRASNWEAYQALSPEEQTKLRGNANAKPTGAAISTKPAELNKLVAVPKPRHTLPLVRGLIIPREMINPNTLLPLPERPPI
jgi:hypothetical protein